MWKLILILIPMLALACLAYADTYKCKSPGGGTVYQNRPCQDSKSETKVHASHSQEDRNQWKLIDQKDEMTDRRQCVIESPMAYVGQQGNDFLFVTIRITTTEKGDFVAGMYSSSPLSSSGIPPSFHNNIENLGIRVDSQPFVSVDKKASQRVLGFDLDNSKLLVSQLANGSQAKLRVRFWPYDQTHEGGNIALSDFRRALQSLGECSGFATGTR